MKKKRTAKKKISVPKGRKTKTKVKVKQQTKERTKTMAVQIEITNANINGEGGSITNATITGEATIAPPTDTGERPTHPILLPPTSDNPDVFFILTFCPNPPPPHWEWIAFSPGSPPDRPTPEPPPSTTPPGEKPPPADGGWGYFPGYGWVYYPGPGGAGPKRRK
jgi:hypothetical protein